jgi:hypothetical protein
VSEPQPEPVDPDVDLHVPAHRAELASGCLLWRLTMPG